MTRDYQHTDVFPAGCMVTDQSGQIFFSNRYVTKRLGFEDTQLVGSPIASIFTNASRLLLERYIYPALLLDGHCEETLLTVLTPGDLRIPVVVNAHNHPDDTSLICWTLFRAEKRHQLHDALMRSRDSLEDRANRLSKLAATDELTGLFNRREFFRLAKLAFENATLNGTSVSLLIADIDLFKRVNDSFGHEAGDDVLRQFGQRLREACHKDELVARYGGEEFVVCLEGVSPSAANGVARRMHDAAGLVETPDTPLTLSIGIGMSFGGSHKSLLETLREADAALYAAKEAGRNCSFLADGDTLIPCK